MFMMSRLENQLGLHLQLLPISIPRKPRIRWNHLQQSISVCVPGCQAFEQKEKYSHPLNRYWGKAVHSIYFGKANGQDVLDVKS
jgi:hypothetical protein